MNGTVRSAKPLGLAAFLATVAMLFTAFTASILVRRTSPDWVRVDLPPIVWVNTAVLLLSSVIMELARRRGDVWLFAAQLLGGAFLVGQVIACTELSRAGLFLRTNPHASFFYVLTAVHGAHLLGGMVAIAWASLRPARLGSTAMYWHFVGALWVYVVVLLSVI